MHQRRMVLSRRDRIQSSRMAKRRNSGIRITSGNSRNTNSLYLLFNLVSRDFKLRYRRSVLGILWSMLNPLLMMVVMALIFSNIFRFSFDLYPFAVYLILGQTFFSVFQDGTNKSLRSIIDAAPLIQKIQVDKIIFPTEKVVFAGVNFCFSLIAIALVMVFFGMVPSWQVVLVPVLLALLLAFTLGVSYIISALVVFFRDVEHLWSVLITIWFYFTPIFWPYDALAGNGFDWVFTLIQFNPMYHFVAAFRQIVTGISLPSDIAVAPEFAICAFFAAVTLGVGLLVFKKLEKKFILYI